MSVRSWRWTSLRLPRNPCIAARLLLKRANLSFVLMYVMTDAYGSLRFSAIFSASLLFTLLHSGAIPPVVVKTRGLNEDFSMSITLWLYLSFFSFTEKVNFTHFDTFPNILKKNEIPIKSLKRVKNSNLGTKSLKVSTDSRLFPARFYVGCEKRKIF